MRETHRFSNKEIWKLLLPLMVEQLLTSLMGMADTVMVSNVGSEAISAVSLVDSINVLVIQALSALSAGGAILCSQYIGKKDMERARKAAEQAALSITFLSVLLAAFCLAFQQPLLRLIFGSVDPLVMENSRTYFFYTALSFPFIALYDVGASIFRAQENTRTPMVISVISNLMNIGGNAFLIWGLHMGVAGAALATLISRIFCGLMVMAWLRRPCWVIRIRNYSRIRPQLQYIRKILWIGIPSGIENAMFQFGKLAIQSTVSTMGTVAIAAQAMTNILENLSGICAMGIGIGLMTIVGQCVGAGEDEEAAYYIKKLSAFSEVVVLAGCLIVYAMTRPVTFLGGMETESARMCLQLVGIITIVKPIVWTGAFIPAYGMRAAGDVRYSMLLSCISMWAFRVTLCIYLTHTFGLGPISVWIGMFTDWTVRSVLYLWRFRSRRWLKHKLIENGQGGLS